MSKTPDALLIQRQSPPRRSATHPAKLSLQERLSTDCSRSDGILYYHPSAKIVHFSPRALAPVPSSTNPSDFDYPVDTIETLPWRSPTERTVALGPLKLENIHGLTIFLKCRSVVHAILKNSQCWCVDGKSTFVLRVRPLTYYRIEIPNESEDDKKSAADLKNTLQGILRYEVTPCPFKRGFTVDIPEESKRPRRKRAWRPREEREKVHADLMCNSNSSEVKDDTPFDRKDSEAWDENETDKATFASKGGAGSASVTVIDNDKRSESSLFLRETGIQRSSLIDDQGFSTLRARFEHDQKTHGRDTILPSSVESFHSAGSSSPLLFPSSSHSDSSARTSIECAEQASWEPQSHDSSPHDEAVSDTPDTCEREISSGDTSVRYTPDRLSGSTSSPETSRKEHEDSSIYTDSEISMRAEFRLRTKAARKREYSPMPPPSILYHPSFDYAGDNGAVSIIQKTCTLVLVPSVQLLLILIHIAASIVAGPTLHSVSGNVDEGEDQDGEAVSSINARLSPWNSNSTNTSQEKLKPDPWDLD